MFHDRITPEQASLIEKSRVFFVASAAPGLEDGPDGSGPVNVSPRGGVPLEVLSPVRIAWLDCPGSGNETKRHSASGGRVTVMVCSFESERTQTSCGYGVPVFEFVRERQTNDRGRAYR